MKKRLWSHSWEHPSGDGSWGQTPGLHRTRKSAEKAVFNMLVNGYPPTNGAYIPTISPGRFREGVLDVRPSR